MYVVHCAFHKALSMFSHITLVAKLVRYGFDKRMRKWMEAG